MAADKKEPAETLTIDFKKPRMLADNEYKGITLREPTGRQMEKAATGNPITSNLTLIAEVADVPLEVVRDMTKREIEKAVAYLNSFE